MTSEELLGNTRFEWGDYILDNLHVSKALMGPAFYRMTTKIQECRAKRDASSAQRCCRTALDTVRQLDASPYLHNYSWCLETRFVQGVFYVCEGVVRLDTDTPGAIDCFEESLKAFSENHTRQRGMALLGQGLVERLAGNVEKSIAHYQMSLDTVHRIIEAEERSALEQQLQKLIEEATDLLFDTKSGHGKTAFPPRKPEPPPPPPARGKKIPIIARIAAGEPILAEENIEDYRLVDEEIAAHVDFGLKVKGDSMTGVAILDGDIVLMQDRNDRAPNGQIVAVIVFQIDAEATLKRFYHHGDHIRLEPANDSFPTVIVKPEAIADGEIRRRYAKTHPRRLLEIYSGEDPQIAGWARALIREKFKLETTK